jgi:hypothetical protein
VVTMNNPTRRSVDGILTGASKPNQKIYIQKRPLNQSQPHKLVSIQPRQPHTYMDIVDISDIKKPGHGRQSAQHNTATPSAPKTTVLDRLDDKEVVLKLPRKLSLRTGLLSLIQYVLIALIAIAGAYSVSIGQWFVLVFAIYVLVRRQHSSLTFGIALFILVTVPIFQLLNQGGVANNLAVYVYELLVVGTIQALIELRWPNDSDSNSVGV